LKRMPVDPLCDISVYRDIYYIGKSFFVQWCTRTELINHCLRYIIGYFREQCLFCDPDCLPFRWCIKTGSSSLWRQVNLSMEWMRFADMAIRLVSTGNSEAD
jgi:hypothetical protein